MNQVGALNLTEFLVCIVGLATLVAVVAIARHRRRP